MTRAERSDVARNRAVVLAAADELFATVSEPARLSMDDVAAAAGVGKGTLFRAFGSRAGLVQALWQRRYEPLRDTIESGPPPLGPRLTHASASRPFWTPSWLSSSTTAT